MSIRLSGLASGMDTESMIKDLMKAERTKVDIQYQKKQILEWKQEDYRDINNKMLTLRNALFDLKLTSSFESNTVQSNNANVLTATAGAGVIDGQYSVNVISLASGVTAASQTSMGSAEDKTSLAAQFGLSDTVSFTLEGSKGSKTFSFDAATTNIYDVIEEINSSEIGINCSYDEGVDRFFLFSDTSGSDVKIDVLDDANGFLRDTLKLYTGDLATAEIPVNLGSGQDAQIEFQGVSGLTFSSNQFSLNGINFSLTGTGETTISITNDTDSTVDKIKKFVEAYNNVMDLIGTKLKEERDRDYQPLTDEEKESMSDSDIELWQEKARQGLLRNETILNSIYNTMRSNATGIVGGLDESNPITSLSRLGITTSANWLDNGKLYIDEDKLKEALTENSEQVMEFFTGNDSADGLADILYEKVNEGITSIKDKAGTSTALYDNSFLGKEIEEVDEQIDIWEERLEEIETRYWNQFTAMEKALQEMNNQSDWLTQQLAGLSS